MLLAFILMSEKGILIFFGNVDLWGISEIKVLILSKNQSTENEFFKLKMRLDY
jgi:hypothetical protein